MRTAMPSQSISISRAIAFLAIGAGLLFISPRAHAADPAEAFVQSRIEVGRAILDDPGLTAKARHQQFREFVLSITDMKRVALFALGTYARDASEADLARFVAAFTDFSVNFYERALDAYAGQPIRLTGSSRRSDDDAVVSAEVADSNGKMRPLKAAFRVRKNERGEPIITDFQAEGAWLALTQRSEFMAFLQQNHGDIVQLAHQLENRVHTDSARAAKPSHEHEGATPTAKRVAGKAIANGSNFADYGRSLSPGGANP